MKTANLELLDRLAAEYVLGTLRGRARRRFEAWLVSPQVESLVKDWESRLAGLEPPLERASPPASVWRGVEGRLGLGRLRRAPAMRRLAAAAAVLLFALAAVLVVFGPPTPPHLVATLRGDLQSESRTIYWRVEILGDNRQISLQVLNIHDLPAGKAHELWALPEDGAPVSLGLMPRAGERRDVLTAVQREALARSKQIAVSLEPRGGSPTGAPTGPVLLVAPLAPV